MIEFDLKIIGLLNHVVINFHNLHRVMVDSHGCKDIMHGKI